MFYSNKELRLSIILLAVSVTAFTAAGFVFSTAAGFLSLGLGLAAISIHLGTEYYRYRKLRKLSGDLDRLLSGGASLPIEDYEEGELSALASQVQKLTLRLTEAADITQKEKHYLADSLADISHQLRTPLTSMNLTVSLLREAGLAEEKRMALTGELKTLLARTNWLVETLLKISKLDAGIAQLTRQSQSVRQLIRRASQSLAIPMDLRNQSLQVRCGEETLSCDPVWTAEALGNILKNCMEHTPEGGCITVTATESALYTQIDVEDTGSGLDPKDIPHLFERFYKGSNSTQSSYGIGLALARTVIAAQNGTIQAANTEMGAKFTIKFYKQVI